jgi:hypothetical protein
VIGFLAFAFAHRADPSNGSSVTISRTSSRRIARAGYVEAASTDRKDREAAVSLFLSDAAWGLTQ